MKNEDIKNLSVWAGAGISMDAPTRLPSGKALTEFIWNQILFYQTEILSIWTEVNNIVSEDINITQYPRLELLLSCVAYAERYLVEGNFMNGFESFAEVDFNYNHILLALLLYHGATIFTANFDLCIEKAYEYLFHEDLVKQKKTKKKKEIIYKTQRGTEIIHFHGTSASGHAMGATLENIMNIVDGAVHNRIIRSFAKEKINIFVGYSLSDEYDINSIIKQIYQNVNMQYTKENYICNHNGWDTLLKPKAEIVFGKNFKIVNEDTTIFLKKVIYINNLENELTNITIQEKSCVNWKEHFIQKINITSELKLISTIIFLNKLNIAVEKISDNIINDYNAIRSSIDDVKKYVLEYHLTANSKVYYMKYKETRLDLPQKQALHNRFDTFKNDMCDFENELNKQEKIIEDIGQWKFWDYEKGEKLSKYIRLLKHSILQNGTSDKYLSQIENILRIINSSNNMESISLVLVAALYRYRMLIDMIMQRRESPYYQQALNMYYDIGTLEGIISTYIDATIGKYAYTEEEVSCEKTVMLQKAKKLAQLIGSYRYIKILEKYEFIHKKN